MLLNTLQGIEEPSPQRTTLPKCQQHYEVEKLCHQVSLWTESLNCTVKQQHWKYSSISHKGQCVSIPSSEAVRAAASGPYYLPLIW